MKPSQLVSTLRRIASNVERSKNPDRNLVARDLKKVVAILLDRMVNIPSVTNIVITKHSIDGSLLSLKLNGSVNGILLNDVILDMDMDGSYISWDDPSMENKIPIGDNQNWGEIVHALEENAEINKEIEKYNGP